MGCSVIEVINGINFLARMGRYIPFVDDPAEFMSQLEEKLEELLFGLDDSLMDETLTRQFYDVVFSSFDGDFFSGQSNISDEVDILIDLLEIDGPGSVVVKLNLNLSAWQQRRPRCPNQ